MSETGTIVLYDVHRGYGFIEPDIPGGYDRSGERRDNTVFLHATQLKLSGIRSVAQGDRVKFDRVPGKRKTELIAGNIQLAA